MKAPSLPTLVLAGCLAISGRSAAAEIPTFGPLPNVGKNWTLSEQGTNGTASRGWSWAVFTNAKNGDMMSFAAERFGNGLAPKVALSGPWLSTVSEVFPAGHPLWVGNPGRGFTGNWLRYSIVELSVGDGLLKKNTSGDALEYSIVFEEDVPGRTGTNRLAHGYGLALGKSRVVVQHTSTRVVTAEDAHAMADALLSIYAHQEAARNPDDKPRAQAEDDAVRGSDIIAIVSVTNVVRSNLVEADKSEAAVFIADASVERIVKGQPISALRIKDAGDSSPFSYDKFFPKAQPQARHLGTSRFLVSLKKTGDTYTASHQDGLAPVYGTGPGARTTWRSVCLTVDEAVAKIEKSLKEI